MSVIGNGRHGNAHYQCGFKKIKKEIKIQFYSCIYTYIQMVIYNNVSLDTPKDQKLHSHTCNIKDQQCPCWCYFFLLLTTLKQTFFMSTVSQRTHIPPPNWFNRCAQHHICVGATKWITIQVEDNKRNQGLQVNTVK